MQKQNLHFLHELYCVLVFMRTGEFLLHRNILCVFYVTQIAKVLRPCREYTAQWICPGSYVSSTQDEIHLFITLSVLCEIFLIFHFYNTEKQCIDNMWKLLSLTIPTLPTEVTYTRGRCRPGSANVFLSLLVVGDSLTQANPDCPRPGTHVSQPRSFSASASLYSSGDTFFSSFPSQVT